MWMNLAILIYIGLQKPFITRYHNRLEMFNEIFICMITGHSLFFTDLVKTRAMRFDVGWSMILFMVLNAAVNLMTVIKLALWNIYLISLKTFRLIRRFFDDNYMREN